MLTPLALSCQAFSSTLCSEISSRVLPGNYAPAVTGSVALLCASSAKFGSGMHFPGSLVQTHACQSHHKALTKRPQSVLIGRGLGYKACTKPPQSVYKAPTKHQQGSHKACTQRVHGSHKAGDAGLLGKAPYSVTVGWYILGSGRGPGATWETGAGSYKGMRREGGEVQSVD